jgi:hypothetical protein
LRRVCSDTTPFIAVLIYAAAGAEMRPHAIYARNDRKKARAHRWLAIVAIRLTVRCPLWVRSGHSQCKRACPLYPRKRTSGDTSSMSALCHKRTCRALRYPKELREEQRGSPRYSITLFDTISVQS